ncbi:hypothetical protein CASFOL_026530 [Castilleja foliolosa]|uniref:KIB1-4 beta-propeller domain-containing protein n=1 Tax=Castilleja foliolosa TaxID=1961234 RepID=A0ABD3CHB8_9LAMI
MAYSSSSLFRLINAKGIVGSSSNYCMLGKWSARCSASLFNLRAFSTATATTAIKAVLNRDSPPWLMLPPEIEAGTTSYKFYSLADDKVLTRCLSDEIRNLRLTCRGSSHGWLALLSQHDGIFLYNPISRRHIKLPSILNLPLRFPCRDIRKDILASARKVDKVILSCSPDEENCRVLIIRDGGNALAFCCPGRSKEWTLVLDENRGSNYYRSDCVYSARLKLFFALACGNGRKLETWDLGDPSSPKLIKVDETNIKQGHFYSLLHTFSPLTYGGKDHLVVAKEDLLLVIQYRMDSVGPDGSCFDLSDNSCPDNYPYMTIGFDIFKYDSEKGKFEYLDSSSLGDLAIFVGKHSHSVAIQATQFPGVKPNSIYFTDTELTGKLEGNERDDNYGLFCCGHDIGIYNYQDKTVSSCYYPCDVPSARRILAAPIWFFPN